MVHILPCGVGTPQIVCHLYVRQSLFHLPLTSVTCTPDDICLYSRERYEEMMEA